MVLLSGCQTSNLSDSSTAKISPDKIFEKEGVIAFPLEQRDDGRLVVKNVMIDGTGFAFLIDSAATKSAVLKDALQRKKLTIEKNRSVDVHGLIETERRDLAEISQVSINGTDLGLSELIILDIDRAPVYGVEGFDGILGMDVLSRFSLSVNYERAEVAFIPNQSIQIAVPPNWIKLHLDTIPQSVNEHPLHFVKVRVAGRLTPMLVDTGSEFSAMNWQAARFAQLKWLKRKLRKNWELEGAIGTFSPKTVVNMSYLRSGQKKWYDKRFIVMDFNIAEELGLKDQAMALGGMDLYGEGSFIIDFERDILAFQRLDNRYERFGNGNKVTVGSPKVHGKRG